MPDVTMRTPVTAQLAEFACQPGVVPPDVLAAAHARLSEARAVGSTAYGDPVTAAAVRAVISSLDGGVPRPGQNATSVSSAEGAPSPQWAALWNALALADGTAAPPVLAALLAVAGPGADDAMAEALAVGAEVAARVSRGCEASGPGAWDTTVLGATLGVTAAVGRMLLLRPDEMVNAFGIAGAQTGVPVVLTAGATRNVLLARAAFLGVEACRLGFAGFDASEQVLEGKGGVGEVLFGTPDYAGIVDQLGTVWS